jgi:hypothetical protein
MTESCDQAQSMGLTYYKSNIKLNYNTIYKGFMLKENNINTLKEFKALNKAYINKLLREIKCLRKVINKFLNNNYNIKASKTFYSHFKLNYII